jgi:hypothetical protein
VTWRRFGAMEELPESSCTISFSAFRVQLRLEVSFHASGIYVYAILLE